MDSTANSGQPTLGDTRRTCGITSTTSSDQGTTKLIRRGTRAYSVGGTRQILSMIAATVTNRCKTRWMIIDEAFNSDKLIELLEALIKDVGMKVFLILDNFGSIIANRLKHVLLNARTRSNCFTCPATARN